MRFIAVLLVTLTSIGACCSAPPAQAQSHQHGMTGPAAGQGDARELVKFPEPMRVHTITSMRDHLLALQEIVIALAQNAFDKAATIAEQRLGMSSLELHGATHIAPFMPQAMQDIGTQMHRAASRFAVDAQTASVSNDVRPALAALGMVMQQCVACHATYRLH
jgi:cytochrome c556